MVNHFQEEKERKKALQKWVKITQNASSPGVGDRCEFFIVVTTSAITQSFRKKKYSVILKKW